MCTSSCSSSVENSFVEFFEPRFVFSLPLTLYRTQSLALNIHKNSQSISPNRLHIKIVYDHDSLICGSANGPLDVLAAESCYCCC